MYKYLIILLSLISFITINPQKMNFEFDFAQFGYDSVSNYVEFYYSFDQSCLKFIDTDTIDYVEGILHIEVTDSATDNKVIDRHWMISNEILDTAGVNQNLIGVIGFVIDKGSYKVIVTGTDANDASIKRTINEYFSVTPFHNQNIAISDIQLASNIIPGSDKTSSIFYKNTYEVTPLPASVCGEQQPVLFYYSELYNLQAGLSNADLSLDKIVVNSRGQVVSRDSKKLKKNVNSRVEVGMVKVHKLPTDTYTLFLYLIDSVANYGVSSSKRFFVYNPSVIPTDTLYQTVSPVLSTTFGAMSQEELDDLFLKSKYIATVPEQNKFDALSTVEAKREFLYTFWKARDENPSDERNQNYQDYLNRIQISNDRYSALGKEGWKTDRGRVLIIYGEPSQIDRHPNEMNLRPYEIWMYESLEGGVSFYFGDITGFNNYQLLHSTKRGELRDDYWQRRITIQ